MHYLHKSNTTLFRHLWIDYRYDPL